jgi:hypothetical protein
MSTYRNDAHDPVTVTWCTRPSHWATTSHDTSDGTPCVTASAVVEPGALLVTQEVENNGPALETILESASLAKELT